MPRAKRTTRLQELEEHCANVGLYVDTYSPGDGVTRYRFDPERPDYFAMRGIYTALGLKEAWAFANGYAYGRASVKVRTDAP